MPRNVLDIELQVARMLTGPTPETPLLLRQPSDWQTTVILVGGDRYIAYQQCPNKIVIVPFEDISPGIRARVRKAVAEDCLDQLIERWTWRHVPRLEETKWLQTMWRTTELFDPWYSLKQKVQSFADLPVDWDGFGRDAIDDQTIENALAVIDQTEAVGATPHWAEPTADGTVSIEAEFNGITFRFEIDDSDLIGAAASKPGAAPEYEDLAVADIDDFVKEHAR